MEKLHWRKVFEEELEYIKTRHKAGPKGKLYGLSISGGGIRSAAFSIGVIQAFENQDKLKKFAYLSTVSGGGYTGSALTWFKQKYNTFPFGKKEDFKGSSFFTAGLAKDNIKTPKAGTAGASNKILSYIRQHGNYLIPHALGVKGLLGRALLSVIHSAFAYFLLLALVFLGFMWVTTIQGLMPLVWQGLGLVGVSDHNIIDILSLWEGQVPDWLQVNFMAFCFLILLAGSVTYGISILLYGFSTFFSQETPTGYCFRVFSEKTMGWMVVLIGVFALFAFIPLGSEALSFSGNKLTGTYAALLAMLGGGASTLFKFWGNISGKKEKNPALNGFIFQIIAVIVIFAVLALGFRAGMFVYYSQTGWWVLLIVTGLFVTFVNLNLVSPHRMYRDRLTETFLWDFKEGPESKLCLRGRLALQTPISSMLVKKPKEWTPYQLINTNLVLTDSKIQKFRGRKGDNFIISAKFCGSEATGYQPTESFLNNRMTLATAMATSGAAVNPNAGVAGQGPTSTRSVSLLMTFFGLRLGIWVPNPGWKLFGKEVTDRLPPNYTFPGLRSLLGFGLNETNYRVELSDGGHFDNTGLYELVRRRLDTIVLSEAGADPDFTLADLGNAIEKVRVDFGVKIEFPEDQIEKLLPDSKTAAEKGSKKVFAEKFSLSQTGFAVGKVDYPAQNNEPEKTGRIIFIKAVLVKGLPGDIYAYKAANPVFPNQTTADQFFDERQFEAYRELGYQLTKPIAEDFK